MRDQIVAFLDLRAGWRELEPEVSEAYRRVVDSGRFVLGPEVEAFEAEFAAAVGARHCVGVGSGFDALQLILRAWGIGEDDEVIVPAFTFVATWLAASLTGATPVGVDVDPATLLIDVEQLEAAITPRTRAIVPVHLYGRTARIEEIGAIAERRGIRVLEDAAQAHGASRAGRFAGSLGDAAAFSFYPTKNLGAMGDGGAVVTDDADLAEAVRRLRSYGGRRDYPGTAGMSSRLDELQAAVLRVKLRHLEGWNRRRRTIADRYLDALSSVSALELPGVDGNAESAWHLFVIAHDERDRLRSRLREAGVETLVHYPTPPHLTDAFRGLAVSPRGFPVAERQASRVLSLPLYPQLRDDHVKRVIEAVRAGAGQA